MISTFEVSFYVLFICIVYCPCLSFNHKKADCIAIFRPERPHSLGSCHFRGVGATCLSHKGGGVPLSALPKDTTSELADLFSTSSPKCRAPGRKVVNTIFKVFWYELTRGMNFKSTDCEADAQTSTLHLILTSRLFGGSICNI